MAFALPRSFFPARSRVSLVCNPSGCSAALPRCCGQGPFLSILPNGCFVLLLPASSEPLYCLVGHVGYSNPSCLPLPIQEPLTSKLVHQSADARRHDGCDYANKDNEENGPEANCIPPLLLFFPSSVADTLSNHLCWVFVLGIVDTQFSHRTSPRLFDNQGPSSEA